MNFPGTCGGTNWAFKISPEAFNQATKDTLIAMISPFGRDATLDDLYKAVTAQ